MMMKGHAQQTGALVLILAGWPVVLAAQTSPDIFDIELEQLEQIIVTAQKREQPLAEVPIAVAAISAEMIAEYSIVNLQGLSAYLPDVTINEAGLDGNLFIRGIGSGVNGGFERSVGTYVDGIYIGRAQMSRLPFLDVERVEVLKGPQGILFGKNTIAGALNITTAAPTDEYQAQIRAYADVEHADTRINASVSGPLGADWSARLSAGYQGSDGYYDHFDVSDEVPELHNRLVRGTLRWQPGDDLEALLKVEHADIDEDGRAKFIVHAGEGSSFGGFVSESHASGGFRPQARDKHGLQSDLVSVNVDYALGEHKFTAISGFLDYTDHQQVDALYSDFFLVPGDDARFSVATRESFTQLSQEVRLLSPQDRDISYLVGIYAQDTKLKVLRHTIWPFDGMTRTSSREGATRTKSRENGTSVAVFGQAVWRATDRLNFSLGARYNHESKHFKRSQISSDSVPPVIYADLPPTGLGRHESRPTGALVAQYNFSDQMMAYVSASSGFKGGGFDQSFTRQVAPGESYDELVEFDKETVGSVEIGSKLTLAGGKLQMNLAGFYSKYDDLQTSVFDGVAGFFVANAASSITRGVELDLRWRASPQLLISVSASYLDAYYDDFPNGPCSQWHAQNTSECSGLSRDLDGESLPFAPQYASHVNIEYTLPLKGNYEVWSSLDVIYSDSFFTASDLDPFTRQDAYTRYDLRIALAPRNDRWELGILAKNLTDEFVIGWSNDLPLSNTPGRENTYTGLAEPPRTLALQARVNF